MQAEHSHKAQAGRRYVNWASFSLENAESDVEHKERVGDVNQHVERFPNRRAKVRQPKIVARGGHKEQNYQSEKAKWLKWNARDAPVNRDRNENAQERICVAAGVVCDNDEDSMNQTERKHRYARMTSVVKQRKECRF